MDDGGLALPGPSEVTACEIGCRLGELIGSFWDVGGGGGGEKSAPTETRPPFAPPPKKKH